MKYLRFLPIALVALSCSSNHEPATADPDLPKETPEVYQPNPQAIALNDRALEIAYPDGGDVSKIDSAMALLDQATTLDSLYALAYLNKMPLLLKLGDFPRLLETNQRICALRPEEPVWLVQRGALLELSDDFTGAELAYQQGIKAYEKQQVHEEVSWEWHLEFAQGLVWAGEPDRAQAVIAQLREDQPDLPIWEGFELPAKEQLLEAMRMSL